jgi:hypothetical protein
MQSAALAVGTVFLASAPASLASPSSHDIGETAAKLPKATASFIVGSIVGTPISMARHAADQVRKGANDIKDGLHNPYSAPIVLILGVPALTAGALGGLVVQGPYSAIYNSWTNAMDKPFSKESFTLGDLGDDY